MNECCVELICVVLLIYSSLGSGLYSHGKECGLNIPEKYIFESFDQVQKINDFFRRCEREKLELIVVILPDRGVTYGNCFVFSQFGHVSYQLILIKFVCIFSASIKKMAELQVGVLTQCLKTQTVQRRLNPATFVNILQKINAKLNGVNHNITDSFW